MRGMKTTRTRHAISWSVTLGLLLAAPSNAAAQWRAADGVAINEVGDPQYSTFSLCAIDPSTGHFKFCRKLSLLQSALIPNLSDLLADDVFVTLHAPKRGIQYAPRFPSGSH